MKKLMMIAAVIAILTLGCAPSDQEAPDGEATPAPDQKITDMDFESGEVDQPADVTEDQDTEPTPETE